MSIIFWQIYISAIIEKTQNCLSPLKKTYLKPKEMYPVQKFYIFLNFAQNPLVTYANYRSKITQKMKMG